MASPDIPLDLTKKREASESTITPKASPRASQSQTPLPSIVPQNTGEWLSFPSFRQSLLGGKSLNRFSNFVTSGAEAFLLHGGPTLEPHPPPASVHTKEDTTASQFEAAEEERNKLGLLGLGEAERHFIDTGSAGPVWRARTPVFRVLVHSPSKRTSALSGAYTMYSITSLFSIPESVVSSDWVEVPDLDEVHPSSAMSSGSDGEATTRMTVQRRFSHFVMLHTVLSRRLPGIALPPLPEKQYAGRFSSDFVEARRGDLERYLNKVVRHPIVRCAEVLTAFLSCEDENVSEFWFISLSSMVVTGFFQEWTRLSAQHITFPSAGPSFFGRTYHPAFNVDLDDAQDAVNSFQTHARAIGKGVQGMRSVFGKLREARIGGLTVLYSV